MSEGFDFLGFRIQRSRKRGSDKWYVCTFIAARPIRQLKDKIRALTNRTSQMDPRTVLIRLNQIMRGWANYFKHAVPKTTLKVIQRFVWRRVMRWWMVLHRWSKKDVRRCFTDHSGRRERPSTDGIGLFDISTVAITRYRYRGNTIPNPWATPTTPEGQSPQRAQCGESRTPVRRAARRDGPVVNTGFALRVDSTRREGRNLLPLVPAGPRPTRSGPRRSAAVSAIAATAWGCPSALIASARWRAARAMTTGSSERSAAVTAR
ncbi:group II intron maturase-specific domain-containing protein [Streptomyces sp. NPDC006368]|uniref:group II intron maturase-specific domain-containing protein n=1 Tax=Streptomyces sp. NPDC006368 TaxID=3156760 RepID=UPI00339F3981